MVSGFASLGAWRDCGTEVQSTALTANQLPEWDLRAEHEDKSDDDDDDEVEDCAGDITLGVTPACVSDSESVQSSDSRWHLIRSIRISHSQAGLG